MSTGTLGTITYIVPTIGRATLIETLNSIECWPGDEILIVGNGYRVNDPRARFLDCPPGGDWGHSERNFAMPHVRTTYTAHIDDDDLYAPGTRALMADAIGKANNKPILFRMRFPNGITLWREPEIKCGNVGTPMMLMPNEPEKLGTWEPFIGGDCAFLESSRWLPSEYVWRPEVIALLRHNTN